MGDILAKNQLNWKRLKQLIESLEMEQSFGCVLSPYAKVLLTSANQLVKDTLELNKGIKHL
jgi:hypothetical protein